MASCNSARLLFLPRLGYCHALCKHSRSQEILLCRLLSWLGNEGHADRALEVFDWLEGRREYVTEDRYLYTRLVSMFGRQKGGLDIAMHIFDRMQAKGVQPDTIAFNSAITVAGEFVNALPGRYKCCACACQSYCKIFPGICSTMQYVMALYHKAASNKRLLDNHMWLCFLAIHCSLRGSITRRQGRELAESAEADFRHAAQ